MLDQLIKIKLMLSQFQPLIYEYCNWYDIAGIKSQNYKEVLKIKRCLIPRKPLKMS